MSSTQFWVGVLVPPIIKRAMPFLKKTFNLPEFDEKTRQRVTSKQYPSFYSALYNLWQVSLFFSPVVFMIIGWIYLFQLFPQKNPGLLLLVGLLNLFGSFFILGAILDIIFWSISPKNFRDYVRYRQIKIGWGFEFKQQIITLLKIGFIYYLITLPLQAYLLLS